MPIFGPPGLWAPWPKQPQTRTKFQTPFLATYQSLPALDRLYGAIPPAAVDEGVNLVAFGISAWKRVETLVKSLDE